MYKIYVDGQHGTTGLLVNERLADHPEVEILEIPYEKRHDRELRTKLLNEADLVFLCLPDEAVEDTVNLITNPGTKIIDASTANRVNEAWAYGLPELSAAHRSKVAGASRVSNPGCHATASIVALYPLVEEGIISRNTAVPLFSITGYTGCRKRSKRYCRETSGSPEKNSPNASFPPETPLRINPCPILPAAKWRSWPF
ncbi:MAG: hypothetical protein SCH66_14845 [Methanolobus sp.]|nr:hypothetical protein [Methanolobus sp.]